jgi:hypothetical protein
MKKPLILVFLLFGSIGNSFSQRNESNFIVGKTILLKSKILNQDREIQIYLPEDYKASNEKCPIIYVFASSNESGSTKSVYS